MFHEVSYLLYELGSILPVVSSQVVKFVEDSEKAVAGRAVRYVQCCRLVLGHDWA